MSPALALVLWWLAFGGTHMVMSAIPVRSRLVAAIGERAFLGVYSLVSFATFIPLVACYLGNRHQGPQLLALGHLPGVRWLALAIAWARLPLANRP